jgi:plastocyanin
MTPTRALGAVLALVLAAGCSGGGGAKQSTGDVTASGPPSAQQATVDMNDRLQFAPNLVRASVGTLTLAVDNVGRVPHNLTFKDSALGATGTVDGGRQATLKVTFDKPGTYRFTCTFHRGMDGQVVVTEKRP